MTKQVQQFKLGSFTGYAVSIGERKSELTDVFPEVPEAEPPLLPSLKPITAG